MLIRIQEGNYVESTSQGIRTQAFPLVVSTNYQTGNVKSDTIFSERVGERGPLHKVDEVDGHG